MFKGVRLNPPVTWLSSALNALLPMLKPEYVAFKVVRAIKRNQTVLVTPRFAYLTHLFKALFPTVVLDAAFDALGAQCVIFLVREGKTLTRSGAPRQQCHGPL